MNRLLIIDDDNEFISDFTLLLGSSFTCLHANTGKEGLQILKEKNPDVVLLDLMLKDGENGLDILKEIRNEDEQAIVIIITDYAAVNTAIEAIRNGAFDYIPKTPNLSNLKLIIEKSLKQKQLIKQVKTYEEELYEPYRLIIGSSPQIFNVKEKILLYANNENSVLITGESGVGKELVARQIHLQSSRKHSPFIAVNCAAIPKELLESELFGYEKGAFTGAYKSKPGKFELADTGTIFLDEISELDKTAQVKLLRFLQEKEFERVGGTRILKSSTRIISASNRNLEELVKQGLFREDLFYRLDVLQIMVPPLRERKSDIPELTEYFINKACLEQKIPLKRIWRNDFSALLNYDWPGNIRELQNVITRSIILSKDEYIIFGDILQQKNSKRSSALIPETWEEMDTLRREAAEAASRVVEKAFLENLLMKFEGNVTKAADHIGISRINLHKMIRKCGM